MKTLKDQVIINWSGGKDASMALWQIWKNPHLKPIALLTTINGNLQRVTMHGVPVSFIQKQADLIGLPLELTELPENISMTSYNEITKKVALAHKKIGVSTYVYGDINLEDLKAFRDKELAKSEIKGLYPLWGRDTKVLSQEFISTGFKAIVVAVSSRVLDKSFAGREFDQSFLNDLPDNVDPCGENGEFHTFVYDGPLFPIPISITPGEITYKKYSSSRDDDDCTCNDTDTQDEWDKGFWFCDLMENPII